MTTREFFRPFSVIRDLRERLVLANHARLRSEDHLARAKSAYDLDRGRLEATITRLEGENFTLTNDYRALVNMMGVSTAPRAPGAKTLFNDDPFVEGKGPDAWMSPASDEDPAIDILSDVIALGGRGD